MSSPVGVREAVALLKLVMTFRPSEVAAEVLLYNSDVADDLEVWLNDLYMDLTYSA